MIPPIAVNFLNLQLGLANAKNHDSPPMAKMLIILGFQTKFGLVSHGKLGRFTLPRFRNVDK